MKRSEAESVAGCSHCPRSSEGVKEHLREDAGTAADPRTMPKAHHLRVEEVRRTLQADGLPFRVQRMESMTVPNGGLIAVSRRPGTGLEDGTEVVLTVSCGPPMVSN